MTWEYRVMDLGPAGDPRFGLVEVYPADATRADERTEWHVAPLGGTVAELRDDLEMMLAALDRPVYVDPDVRPE